ncbi:hypothetical protein BDW74DRAFT_95500 [Aspergillus multicolor]|uniref:uncharacterized protein n=1 Tax=Aspergillus multicolor TaxID=41759 RepID=UPI003CCE396C
MHIIKVQALSASLLATLAVSAPVSLGGQAQVRSAQTPKSGEFFYRDVEAPVVETESTTTGPNGSLDWLRARDRTAHIDRARRQGNISPGRGAWIFQEVPGSETEDAASVKRARAPDVADSAEKTRGVTTYGPNIYYAAGVDVPGETAKTAGANIASGPNGAQDWLLEDGDDSASIKARAPQGFEKGSYAYRKTAGPVSKDLADTSSHPSSVQTSNVEADGEVQASSVGVLE